MSRKVKVSELIGMQINDGSMTFEIEKYDSQRRVFWVDEIVYNEEKDEDEKSGKPFRLTKREVENALHHFDGTNHTVVNDLE